MNKTREAYKLGYQWARCCEKSSEQTRLLPRDVDYLRYRGYANVPAFRQGIKSWEDRCFLYRETPSHWHLRQKLVRKRKPGLGRVVWLQTPYGHWVRRKKTPLY